MDITTEAQRLMLDVLDSTLVRRSYARDDSTVWLINGRHATAGEARVIASLQEKQLVKTVRENVTIVGWVGSKTVSRLVRK